MMPLKIATAILATLCLATFAKAKSHFSLKEWKSNDTEIILPNFKAVETDQQSYIVCRDLSKNGTLFCHVHVESWRDGTKYRETCPTVLSPNSKDGSYIDADKTLLPTWGKIIIVWFNRVRKDDTRQLPITIKTRLINMTNCQATADASIYVDTFESPAADDRIKILPFDDGTFDAIYLNKFGCDNYLPRTSSDIQPMTCRLRFNINNEPMGKSVSLYAKIPANLRNPLNSRFREDGLHSPVNHWMPISRISPATGYFLLTMSAFTMPVNISVVSSTGDVDVTVPLKAQHRETYGLAYGEGNVAFYTANEQETQLRCLLFDYQLNLVHNLTIPSGYQLKFAQIFVVAPNQLAVVVADGLKDDSNWSLRLYKIDERGNVGKPVVLEELEESYDKLTEDKYVPSLMYLSFVGEQLCFNWPFLTIMQNNWGSLRLTTTCIDKRAFDRSY